MHFSTNLSEVAEAAHLWVAFIDIQRRNIPHIETIFYK
jgi:hypothetical protein